MAEIINLGNSMVNTFVIKYDNCLVLVDSGYAKGFEKFKKKFEENGFKWKDVKFMFLTHCHDDHTGFLNQLLDLTGAKLILHKEAVDRLKLGHNPHTHGASYKLMQIIVKMMNKKEKYFPRVDRVDDYLIFNENEQYLKDSGLEGEIVYLPGHTADSIGIMFDDGRLICGDTAMDMPIAKKYFPLVLEDAEQLRKTWDYMLTNAKIVVTSHGKPIPVDTLKKYRPAMDKLKVLKVY